MGVGVIGCGYWGPNLTRNFNGLSDCDVIRVADLSGFVQAFNKATWCKHHGRPISADLPP